MAGGQVEVVLIVVPLDTPVATCEGARTAASAVARKTNDRKPDTRLAPMQKLRAEATECKACAKASGCLNV